MPNKCTRHNHNIHNHNINIHPYILYIDNKLRSILHRYIYNLLIRFIMIMLFIIMLMYFAIIYNNQNDRNNNNNNNDKSMIYSFIISIMVITLLTLIHLCIVNYT